MNEYIVVYLFLAAAYLDLRIVDAAFSASVLGNGSGLCQCPCQAECPGALLNCVNGGSMAPKTCLDTMRCRGWNSTSTCSCPSGYAGVNCEILKPSQKEDCKISDGLFYDASLVNTEAKKVAECQIIQNSETKLLDLQDHRVNVSLDLPNGIVDVGLYSRVGLDSKPGECSNMKRFFQCRASGCIVLSDGDQSRLTVSCPNKECSACTSSEGCKPIIGTIVKAFERNKDPFLFKASKSDTFEVAVSATLSTGFLKLNIPMVCLVGACVKSIGQHTSSPTPDVIVADDSWMIAVSTTSAAILYSILAILAVLANTEMRHPPKEVRKLVKKYGDGELYDHLGYIRHSSVASSIASTIPSPGASEAEADSSLPIVVAPGTDDQQHDNGEFGIVWRNICYSLPPSTSLRLPAFLSPASVTPHKSILNEVSGAVRPGEIVAVLGASGSGKSTLLDILGDLQKKGKVGGRVSLYGDQRAKRRDVLSYVVQDDYNLETMTVWESLVFSARTRLPRTTSYKQILKMVTNTLEELELAKIATSKIGHPDRGGISGGERRRLAIGVELVANPRILLLDEPTSGLDSFFADLVVRVLRRRAERDRCAVLLTIHQPPSHLFSFFHKIILISKGGHLAFYGDPNSAIRFFEQQSGIGPMLEGANPFEFLVEALSTNSRHHDMDLVDSFQRSEFYSNLMNVVDEGERLQDSRRQLPRRITLRYPFWKQVIVLSKRGFRHIARDPSLLFTYNLVTMLVAFLSGCIFYQLTDDFAGVQNRFGFLFFTILFLSLLSMSSMGLFVMERVLLWREHYAGFYSTAPYFLSKMVVDLFPFRILPPILYASISYWMVGLRPEFTRFLVFVGTLVLANMVAGSSVFLISASSSNIGHANLAGVLYFIYALVFGGLLLNAQGTNGDGTGPKYLQSLSFINYAFENLMVNEFEGLPVVIQTDGISLSVDGSYVLKLFDFDANDTAQNIVILACGQILLTIITYVVLKFCQKRRK